MTEMREERWGVTYRGISESTKGKKYPPVYVYDVRFLGASIKAVVQVEEQEPGNFEIVSIWRCNNV